MINWTPLRDRHSSGETELGKVWLRTDRTGQVTGVYTLFGKTKKLVPGTDEQWTVADGQTVAELELEEEIKFRKKQKEILES